MPDKFKASRAAKQGADRDWSPNAIHMPRIIMEARGLRIAPEPQFPPGLRYACDRCHAARHRSDLVYEAGKFLCIHKQRCDKELLAYIAANEDRKGVAIGSSQAHNEHKDGGPVMWDTATHEGKIGATREMLAQKVSVTKIRDATGFGIGTIIRMRDHPDYAPTERGSASRKAGWESGNRKSGGGRGHRAAVDTAVQTYPEGVPTGQAAESLKTRMLAAISARHPDRFDTAFELRNAIVRPGENIDGHAVTHLLFTLRSGGWIKFHESKTRMLDKGSGGQTVVTDIRLTDQGFSQIRRANGAAQALRGDFPPTAPVTAPPVPEEAPAAPAPTPVEVAPPAAPVREQETLWGNDRYPLIRNLILRPSKIAGAAKLLREAGMEEAATLIEAEQRQLSPLEEEILALLKEYDIHPTR